MVQSSLANQMLTLHIYGNANEIRKTMHPTESYTYTGETTTNWAITVSDKTSYWDATGDSRISTTAGITTALGTVARGAAARVRLAAGWAGAPGDGELEPVTEASFPNAEDERFMGRLVVRSTA